jgi:hypothetical protein
MLRIAAHAHCTTQVVHGHTISQSETANTDRARALGDMYEDGAGVSPPLGQEDHTSYQPMTDARPEQESPLAPRARSTAGVRRHATPAGAARSRQQGARSRRARATRTGSPRVAFSSNRRLHRGKTVCIIQLYRYR